jgi:hypothetical protein
MKDHVRDDRFSGYTAGGAWQDTMPGLARAGGGVGQRRLAAP